MTGKRIFVFGAIISSLAVSPLVITNNEAKTNAQSGSNRATTEASFDMGYTTIDGINVPFEVLMYAQLEYQGHAVTQAAKVVHNGQPAYRLRVDRDIYPDDYDSFHLFYDMEWELLDENQTQAPPPPPPAPEPKPEPKPEPPKPEKPDKPEPTEEIEEREGPIGGNARDSSDEEPAEETTDQEAADDSDDEQTTTSTDKPRRQQENLMDGDVSGGN